jgi:hypothetical protein
MGATGPVECQQLTLPATAHEQQFQVVDALPVGAGGTLKDGNYELIAHIRYRAMTSGEEAGSMRAALRLRNGATVMDYLYDEGAPGEPENASGFTARVALKGNVMQLEMVCPPSRSSAVGYTAAGDELSLFEENEELRFQRR